MLKSMTVAALETDTEDIGMPANFFPFSPSDKEDSDTVVLQCSLEAGRVIPPHYFFLPCHVASFPRCIAPHGAAEGTTHVCIMYYNFYPSRQREIDAQHAPSTPLAVVYQRASCYERGTERDAE